MNADAETLQKLIASIVTWKKEEQRAPHKPLMLLLALANLQAAGQRLQLFTDIEPKLTRAMDLFGPAGRVPTPQYPFCRLLNDKLNKEDPVGMWEMQADGKMQVRQGSKDPQKEELRAKRARAGFIEPYFKLLLSDKALQDRIIHQILDAHFPPSIHEDLLAFFNLCVGGPPEQDPIPAGDFRQRVLQAYGWQCAVSHFSVSFRKTTLGVEPAHIRWPQAGGSHSVSNAAALSTLHRKLFHLGVFTIDSDYRVQVSPGATEEALPPGMLSQFHGKKIRLPSNPKDYPDKESLAWHQAEVFRG
jgi:putative restriction endonuclease